jgi:hypothetical protein
VKNGLIGNDWVEIKSAFLKAYGASHTTLAALSTSKKLKEGIFLF